MEDLTLDRSLKRGNRGKKVRLIQEWLSLHNVGVAVDGNFGPATDRAVREFQQRRRLAVDGIVGKNTFAALVKPMRSALAPIAPGTRTLGQLVVAYARRHEKVHPREVGGENCGPWVRLYMNGNQGPQWAWCAGFVSFLLRQACDTLRQSPPVKSTFSCDVLAEDARRKNALLCRPAVRQRLSIGPGSFFLARRTSTDWVHTGIVVEAREETLETIEGNTNDEGSREGYEVCRRIRGYKNKDFVLI